LGLSGSAAALARASAAASRIRASLGSTAAITPVLAGAAARPSSSSPPRCSPLWRGSVPESMLSPHRRRGADIQAGSQRAETPTRMVDARTEAGLQYDVAASSDTDLASTTTLQLQSERGSRCSTQEGRSRSTSPRLLASSSSGHDCESAASTASTVPSLPAIGRMGPASSSCEVFFIGTPRCM
jgi:hypothetical protein